MRLLVTGGAGFIGSNFIRYMLDKHPGWKVTNLDKLTYAGNLENLEDIQDNKVYKFVHGDIADRELLDKLLSQGFDAIVNFAAESHVDRSILDGSPFIETNVHGTQVLLEGTRKYQIPRFIQVSTDEVYGSIDVGKFSESSSLVPSSPYSASKAAADLLCVSYCKTYHTPIIITRCSNNYGPYQFPEKLIPLTITNAIEDKTIPIYGDGLNVRDWIFVTDHCRAIDVILQRGRLGEVYNIAGNNEKTNLNIVNIVLKILGKPRSLAKFVTDRPGHDRRYALDTTKITQELGWQATASFEYELAETVAWYITHEPWWRRIKSGEYAKFYERMYLHR